MLRKNNSSSGYTLLELIIVMFLIGIIAFFVPPVMTKTIETLKFRTFTKNIASLLRYARRQAISEKTPISFYLDKSKNAYWVSSKNQSSESSPSASSSDPIKKKIPEDIVVTLKKSTEWLDYQSKKKASSQEKIKLYGQKSEKNKQNKNLSTIDFFPNGSSKGGKITIKKKRSSKDPDDADSFSFEESYYEIDIDFMTGKINLFDYGESDS